MATNIIQTGGKVIRSGTGHTFKQNYQYGMGLQDTIGYRVAFAQPMAEYTIVNICNAQTDVVPTTVSGSSGARHLFFNTFDETGAQLEALTHATSFRAMAVVHTLDDGTIVNATSTAGVNLATKAYLTVGVTYRKQPGQSHIRFVQAPGYLQQTTTLLPPTGRKMKTYERLSFSVHSVHTVWHTRLCIFNRYLADREINFLYNNGNSNDVLSSLGLVCELNFVKAEIINIPGLGDRVGFRDESGNSNHAYITQGLPTGTLQEQVNFINQSRLRKWTF